jgi:hypothetical protein
MTCRPIFKLLAFLTIAPVGRFAQADYTKRGDELFQGWLPVSMLTARLL